MTRKIPGKGRISRAGEKTSQPGHQAGFGPNHECGELPGAPASRREKIRSVGIVVALECGPGRVDDEAGEDHEDDRRLHLPSVTAHALAETTPNHRKLGVRHEERLLPVAAWRSRSSGRTDASQQGYSRRLGRPVNGLRVACGAFALLPAKSIKRADPLPQVRAERRRQQGQPKLIVS